MFFVNHLNTTLLAPSVSYRESSSTSNKEYELFVNKPFFCGWKVEIRFCVLQFHEATGILIFLIFLLWLFLYKFHNNFSGRVNQSYAWFDSLDSLNMHKIIFDDNKMLKKTYKQNISVSFQVLFHLLTPSFQS